MHYRLSDALCASWRSALSFLVLLIYQVICCTMVSGASMQGPMPYFSTNRCHQGFLHPAFSLFACFSYIQSPCLIFHPIDAFRAAYTLHFVLSCSSGVVLYQVRRRLGVSFHHHFLSPDVREHDPRHDGRQNGEATEGRIRTSGRQAVRRACRRPQHAKEVRAARGLCFCRFASSLFFYS